MVTAFTYSIDETAFIPKRNERSELVHSRMSAGKARINTPLLAAERKPYEQLRIQGLSWGMIPFILGKSLAEKKLKKISINIRRLVEIMYASGSLNEITMLSASAEAGKKIHQQYQNRGIEEYQAEVMLKKEFNGEFICLNVNGRADGVFQDFDRHFHIEEIKSVKMEVEFIPDEGFPVHWAQLYFYGWLFCLTEDLECITLDLLYFSRTSKSEKILTKDFTRKELSDICLPLVESYMEWLNKLEERRTRVFSSISEMDFPFKDFRPGQRELSKIAYRGIRDHKIIYLQAATGIGKTMAFIFSALKALAEEFTEKLFFLTAKNAGSLAAEKALEFVKKSGIDISWILITAKAKICFLLENEDFSRPPCSPEVCKYAKNYFDKLPGALEEIFENSDFPRSRIEELAEKHELCPFEYSLDLSLYCDFVIADYNYAFDFASGLKRYFKGGKRPYTLLIDEAHNIIPRARSMYSAELNKKNILKARREGHSSEQKILSRLNTWLLSIKNEIGPWHEKVEENCPDSLFEIVDKCVSQLEALNERGQPFSISVLQLYWELTAFLRILDFYDGSYRTLIKTDKSNIIISLLCIDPSQHLERILKKQDSSLFFSATLEPVNYTASLITPELGTEYYNIPSPFKKENCLQIIDTSLSTRWRDRKNSYSKYAELTASLREAVSGNMMIFSPSFAFQDELLNQLDLFDKEGSLKSEKGNIQIQRSGMTAKERNQFLDSFEGSSVCGFCVIGGSFTESVDLIGSKLIGVLIFGLGLPQVNLVTKTYSTYFEGKFNDGYNYAYTYPGITRILQAAGRVIRSSGDKGFIYLADDRYGSSLYRKLIPEHWDPVYCEENSGVLELFEKFR